MRDGAQANMTTDLDALQALADAATPGPWTDHWANDERSDLGEAAIVSGPGTGLEGIVVGTLYYDGLHTACRAEDAAFIAAARTAVPELIAEVRALRAEVERLRDALENVRLGAYPCRVEDCVSCPSAIARAALAKVTK